jgi:hypothetical protein
MAGGEPALAEAQKRSRASAPPPLFQPFRALGYITDGVPFAVQRRGKETYVTVSVGRAWQVDGPEIARNFLDHPPPAL